MCFVNWRFRSFVQYIIKLTHSDQPEKRAQYSQIVRAKETLKLGHGGPSYSQASDTHCRAIK